MIRLIILLLILSVSAADLSAAGDKKISIAITDIRANNTKEGYGKACVDILSEKLFASGVFTLMERSQMDKIARMNGFTEFSLADPEQVSKLGRKLKVEKMIAGSITFLDVYIIEVKVFDAATGKVEFSTKRKIGSIEKLENAVDEIALSVERHSLGYYTLSGDYDITLEALYLVPVALFGRGLNPGPGAQVVVDFNTPFGFPFDIHAITGFYSFEPEPDSVNHFYMYPAYLTFSHRFTVTRTLNFIPSAGGGYVFSKVSFKDTAVAECVYWSSRSFYYNPAIVVRGEIDVLLHDRWYIAVTPQYNIFFEKGGKTGQFVSLSLGIKMLF